MDDALIALVLIAISFLSWLFQKGGPIDKMRGKVNPGEADGDNVHSARKNAELSEEERARRFMEALGLPTGSSLPRPEPDHPRLANPPPLPHHKVPSPAPARPKTAVRTPSTLSAEKDNFWDSKAGGKTFSWDSEEATPEAYRRRAAQSAASPSLSKAEADALARIEREGSEEPWGARKPRARRKQASVPVGGIRSLFASRDAARSAILAQEILGKPRGLQSLPGPATFHSS